MFRIRQQHWFCLAAICLVGSLLAIWSMEIPVADDVAALPGALKRPVLRHLNELPDSSSLLKLHSDGYHSEANRHDGMTRGGTSSEVVILAPAGVSGRSASPLNTTGRVILRDRISPVGFQQTASASVKSVWLSGQIEPLEQIP